MSQTPTNPLIRALDSLIEGKAGSWVINLFVIPSLVLLALVLPPLALPQRVLSAGYSPISTTGGSISSNDGTQFTIPAGATKSGVNIRLDMQPHDKFMNSAMAASLPATVDVKSPLYQPSLQGTVPTQANLSIPIPDGFDQFAMLDVYGYTGKKWVKIPFQLYLDEQRIESYLSGFIPQGVIVVQTGTPAPTISADLSAKTILPNQVTPLLAEVNPIGLNLADSGGVAGSVPELPETSASSPYQILPTITNFDGDKFRGDLVDDMITNADTRKVHIQTLVDLAVEKLYPGFNIDYQDMAPANQAAFTTFVKELATALHAKDKILSVTMALPEQKSMDTWATDAFDWMAIGQLADVVKIPLPNERTSYAGNENSQVNAYLQWAVGRVDRYKLQLAFSALGRDEFGNAYAPISFASAFKIVGVPDIPPTVLPNAKVTFDLPLLRDGGIKTDAATGLFYFSYKDDKGMAHTVYIESADSLSKKLALALNYNLRGIALRDLAPDSIDIRVWDALSKYRDTQAVAFTSKPTISWRVNEQVVGKVSGNDPRFAWTSPAQGGQVKVDAAISLDENQPPVNMSAVAQVNVVAPTPTPQPTARPTAVAVATKPAPGPATAPPITSAFRGQNLFNYGAQLNWTNMPTDAEMGQLNQLGFKWAKIQVRWCDLEGNRGNIDYSQTDRFVNAAAGRGIKVLFSVVCAPNWSRADRGAGGSGPPDNMQDAADFMGNMAAKYCGGALGAIEVWNEHNLLTEWHGKSISAAMYMDMLRKSYNTIKARCPGIIVVSGAPTPTGVTSDTAVDDVAFLHQMYQNGLKDYSDAIGSHPSGFCNSYNATIGQPNPCGGQYNNHRSFFFMETMKAYRAVMVQYGDSNKQIWATEFGWGVDPSPKPGYDYEKHISPDLQAQWLVGAFQWSKSVGYAGVMILWNLDFMDMGNETGAFHVLGRPAFDALAAMPK
ncbi:MAG: hypothetical protein HZB51_12415 [Chloroflexi bacterium]|nr:hypothetical protein [Chloroflexota bacterium]